MSYHVLMCLDGKWLSDRRDTIPLFFIAPNGLLTKCREEKLEDIDLSTLLYTAKPDKSWFSIYGSCVIKEDYGSSLSCEIACAFVSRSKSVVFRRKIQQIENPYWYRLPIYSEGREMIELLTKSSTGEELLIFQRLQILQAWTKTILMPEKSPIFQLI